MSNSTLIISDIHLGSTLSSAHLVMDFLKKASFHRLILLGDIFDGIHIYRFKPTEWELLAYLEKLAEQGKDVIWVKGNHDVVDVEKMPNLKIHWQCLMNSARLTLVSGLKFQRFTGKMALPSSSIFTIGNGRNDLLNILNVFAWMDISPTLVTNTCPVIPMISPISVCFLNSKSNRFLSSFGQISSLRI